MHLPFDRLGRKVVTRLPMHDPASHVEVQSWSTAFVDSVRTSA